VCDPFEGQNGEVSDGECAFSEGEFLDTGVNFGGDAGVFIWVKEADGRGIEAAQGWTFAPDAAEHFGPFGRREARSGAEVWVESAYAVEDGFAEEEGAFRKTTFEAFGVDGAFCGWPGHDMGVLVFIDELPGEQVEIVVSDALAGNGEGVGEEAAIVVGEGEPGCGGELSPGVAGTASVAEGNSQVCQVDLLGEGFEHGGEEGCVVLIDDDDAVVASLVIRDAVEAFQKFLRATTGPDDEGTEGVLGAVAGPVRDILD